MTPNAVVFCREGGKASASSRTNGVLQRSPKRGIKTGADLTSLMLHTIALVLERKQELSQLRECWALCKGLCGESETAAMRS